MAQECLNSETGNRIFNITVPLSGEVKLEAVSGELKDQSVVRHVDTPNPDYILRKGEGKGKNWV